MSDITHYVAYYVAQLHKGPVRNHTSHEGTGISKSDIQQQSILDFSRSSTTVSIIDTYKELPDNRRNAKWPQLQKAMEACRKHHATLLIAELGTLASNESFAQILLDAKVTFHCLDQPFVNQTILEALSKHAQVQRKLHGKLIREGLKMTSAKSGNPNAAEVISKVNKPKIDTAIVFALLLLPIILDYRRKGLSQRGMVQALNAEGFTAPEGGKWVLSQLQKVLDRVRLNEIATETKAIIQPAISEGQSLIQIAEMLNAKNILSLKRGPWDESQIKKLKDRIQQIEDIVHINRFVLGLLPVLHEYQRKNMTIPDILKTLHHLGLPLRSNMPLEVVNTTVPPGIERLKQDLSAFSKESAFLENALESAIKHIPAYLKIVKGHIDQLAKVLALETHDHRNLDNVGLAEPVMQLMQLFRELNDDDLQLLETLAYETRHWQTHPEHATTMPATLAAESIG